MTIESNKTDKWKENNQRLYAVENYLHKEEEEENTPEKKKRVKRGDDRVEKIQSVRPREQYMVIQDVFIYNTILSEYCTQAMNVNMLLIAIWLTNYWQTKKCRFVKRKRNETKSNLAVVMMIATVAVFTIFVVVVAAALFSFQRDLYVWWATVCEYSEYTKSVYNINIYR